jgi:cellulose synthase/poly-beta-1,6-N-acetylglucosamine synthase-like glycosyltransferase
MNALLLIAWIVIALVATYGTYTYWARVAQKVELPAASGVVVLIPVKGSPGGAAALERFLASCLGQRGIDYRLIFAVESPDDAAAAPIARLARENPRVSLVIAGQATVRGQKVHNQLAALATLRPEDRFVVFADADVVLDPHWLAQLLRPIVLGYAELTTGYRWILPSDDRFASRACALIDWRVATSPRSPHWSLCWGGSMAMTRDVLDRLDLPRVWNNALLDDLVLTRTARHAGVLLGDAVRVLVPSPVSHDMASLFDFGRRQYLLLRVHAPWHWWLSGITLVVPALAGGAALVMAAQGSMVAVACLAVALALQQLRAQLRIGIAWRVLPGHARQSAMVLRRDRWLLPAIHMLHLAIWLTSMCGRTMTWAGKRYRLLGFGRVEIVGRSEAASWRRRSV